jgi:hypothetical protein
MMEEAEEDEDNSDSESEEKEDDVSFKVDSLKTNRA